MNPVFRHGDLMKHGLRSPMIGVFAGAVAVFWTLLAEAFLWDSEPIFRRAFTIGTGALAGIAVAVSLLFLMKVRRSP